MEARKKDQVYIVDTRVQAAMEKRLDVQLDRYVCVCMCVCVCMHVCGFMHEYMYAKQLKSAVEHVKKTRSMQWIHVCKQLWGRGLMCS